MRTDRLCNTPDQALLTHVVKHAGPEQRRIFQPPARLGHNPTEVRLITVAFTQLYPEGQELLRALRTKDRRVRFHQQRRLFGKVENSSSRRDVQMPKFR